MEEQTTRLLKDLLRTVVPGQETALDITRELLGEAGADGKRITLAIQQRHLNAEPLADPIRERSPRRMHTFYDVAGFCRYLNEFGGPNTVVLADPVAQHVDAVLDERAERGFEILRFVPLAHPLFIPWRDNITPGLMALKAFLQLVSENRRQIVEPEGRALKMMLSQVRMSRKVEVAQGYGAKTVNGLMVETVVQAGAPGRMEPVDLPETLVIRCPLYVATSERRMEMDIGLEASEQAGVLVTLSSGDVPVIRVAVFEEMLESIKESLQTGMTAMGAPHHEDWATLLPADDE